MKGIILSGGYGTRLSPLTIPYSKQLLPIYDKPMIYYPLTTLMSLGINDILVITTPTDNALFKRLFKNSNQWGIKISFAVQKTPKGIAESFILAENFIKNDDVTLILGDNIYNGINYIKIKNIINNNFSGSLIFTYKVDNPKRYGVAEVKNDKVISIREKPKKPKSNLAVTGLYVYDNSVIKIAKNLKPSKRKELEITDVNKVFIKKKKLNNILLDRGSVWLDAGTFDSLLQSSMYVQTIQNRQNILIGSPEEISYLNGWITKNKFKLIINNLPKNNYRKYLEQLMS
ncbi:glucose-1-phosphate thymidylyltransferase RfbA [Pelagibacteraceae bacterium]|nr:glucose-1-phosphate thymidylyltransferase RfbA [Pelagibacteraceae bacterium]